MNHRALGASTGLGREPGGQHTSAEQQQDTYVSHGLVGEAVFQSQPLGKARAECGGSSCVCCLCPPRLSIKASFPLLDTPWEKQAWLGSAEGQLAWIHKQGMTGGHGS